MAKRGRDLGALDYLVKPFGGDRLAGALRRAIDWHREAVATREWIDRLRTEQLDRRSRLERLLHRREAATPEPDSRLQEFGLSKKSAWGSGQLNQFAEWRRTVDPNGFTAAERVMRLAVATASRLGLGTREIDALRGAALLHDVGLMTMPPALMEKPAGFTTEERALVQQHPVIAFKMLEAHPALADVATVILSAYEAYSGKGYPQGLSREEIPLTSRILAVAIAYHAMMASRPHRPALQSSDALLELCRCQTSQFDPTVVAAFVRMLTEH
jgi:HD-GYP domain-containing protein (c-di-GMP phosphodiesterase class II)